MLCWGKFKDAFVANFNLLELSCCIWIAYSLNKLLARRQVVVMKCHHCKENKLSKEFPFYPLTDHCDHPLLHCLDVSIQIAYSYWFCFKFHVHVAKIRCMMLCVYVGYMCVSMYVWILSLDPEKFEPQTYCSSVSITLYLETNERSISRQQRWISSQISTCHRTTGFSERTKA